uniref:D,D-heptose 1,7-bisphosphate phosphatase n=1 Tax=Candidatus Kentrum eta TaxID=2126337 RepID=A0A450UNS1_9GAMM|nr:MAG: D-alpha,beta-D-heptose 1,7-bisphosphate phosphatase [Candidatus Kentron sp. H]VFJ94192.1 MAG: D-alpha,beta-D-heptose 1,7-bisphosphate phosphatase [Candidatus Kentron sp. H]VFK00873.1 MAG: D-alpha,beta-D-heptose 1,7-bisphosphate phosphatase [Candidatus Kentron sp. H]
MKLVILDRDGVINEDSDHFIRTRDQYIPIPDSIQAIARLGRHGYTVAVATNQSGIARGLLTLRDLEGIHHKLEQLVIAAGGRIDKIVFCPHGPEEGCDCRKPEAGLMKQLIETLGMPEICFVVGDNLRDLQAGMAVGAIPLLVRTGKGKRTIVNGSLSEQTMIFEDLAAAVDWLIGRGSDLNPIPDLKKAFSLSEHRKLTTDESLIGGSS